MRRVAFDMAVNLGNGLAISMRNNGAGTRLS